MVGFDYNEVLNHAKKYFDGDEMSASTWINKYALKDSAGHIFELNPLDMHKRLASELARIEVKYENPISEKEILDLLHRFQFIVPQGSPMAGIGNDRQTISISNCFVVGNPEGMGDSYGSILRIDERIAQLEKRRCGVGNDVSDIRPAGVAVANAAITSTGVVPFMERYSNTTREVAQDGRRGALMLTIDCKHPETEQVVDAKMSRTKITGANVSIKIHDDFMETMLAHGQYMQQWPIYGDPKIQKEIDAVKLWDKIIFNAWDCAEPGVLFWDQIIRESPADCYAHLGFRTVSTNPCGELPLCVGDSCRLLILNLFSYVINPFTNRAYFDFELFKKHAHIAQRLMDDIVDLEIEKIDQILAKIARDPENDEIKYNERTMWEEIREKCENGRRTGTGVTGEGDMLAALGLTYGTPKATEFAVSVHKCLAIEAYKESCILAKERGSFPIYNAELEKNNPFINRLRAADPELDKLMKKHGRRNISLLTIAPCGTVSMMTQTSSGVECAIYIFYIRRRKINPNDKNVRIDFTDANGDCWQEYPVFHHHFLTWAKIQGFDVDEIKKMSKGALEQFVTTSPYYKATSNDVDWLEKVRMQGQIQKWVDHSISVTVNLPKHVTPELVNQVYVEAWRAGCKGCTIYREGSRTGVIIQEKEKDYKKENHAPKRPKFLDADIHRFTNKGEKWVCIIGKFEDENRPYEIFTGIAESLDIPNSIERGRIRKTKVEDKKGEKHSKYDLLYTDKDGEERTVEWLNHTFSKEYWNYAKMLSGVLRHRMPLPYVVDLVSSLNLDDEVLTTWKAGVARMVKKYIPDGTEASDKTCKDCKQETVVYQEGCLICKNCGSSKCG